jgi:hypothetical protein
MLYMVHRHSQWPSVLHAVRNPSTLHQQGTWLLSLRTDRTSRGGVRITRLRYVGYGPFFCPLGWTNGSNSPMIVPVVTNRRSIRESMRLNLYGLTRSGINQLRSPASRGGCSLLFAAPHASRVPAPRLIAGYEFVVSRKQRAQGS